MNAYELLNIDEQLYEKLKSIGEYSINSMATIRAKRNLDRGILEINRIFEGPDNMEIKLQKIQEKISEISLYVIAHDQIGTEKARREYDKKGRTDIKRMMDCMEKKLENAVIIKSNGKGLNALQVLGISSEKISSQISPEERKRILRRQGISSEEISEEIFQEKKDQIVKEKLKEQDESIRNKTFAAIKMAVQSSELKDIESIKEMILTTTKYLWAYSRIKSPQLRQTYQYQQLARKGDKAAKSLGKPQVLPLQDQPFVYIEMVDDDMYDHMILTKVAVLQSYAFVAEQHGYGYTVAKFRKDDKVEDSEIFSNININRMKKDLIYRKKVEESLLSNENMKMGQEILGGYIGEIDENGKVYYDSEAIGISRAYWREKAKEMQKRDESKEKQEKNKDADNDKHDEHDDREQ